jgi:hypothetical protein
VTKLVMSELQGLSPEAKTNKINAFVALYHKPDLSVVAKYRSSVEERCQAFRNHYGLSIDKLKELLAAGDVRETSDYCTWLLLEEELADMRARV